MKKFALIMGLVLAMGAGFMFNDVSAQSDPWWHPLNPQGGSHGVTYGTVLPTTANTGYPPTDGLLAIQITTGGVPTFNMYDQSTTSWLTFGALPAGGITDDTIPVWNAAGNAFEDSLLTDDGTDITLASGQLLGPNGTNALPTFGFSGDPDSGMYLSGVDQIGLAVNAIERFVLTTGGQVRLVASGSAAGPTYSYTTDTDTGIYRIAANNIGMSVGGALVMDWDATNAAGAGSDLVTISSTLGIMDAVGTDVFNGLLVALTNANHTGGEVNGAKIDDITGDANALEYAYHAGTGWDGAFYHEGIAHADLQAAANGSIVFCTDCDPASTPCTSAGAASGAFAFRVNGQWDCPW